MEFEFGKNLVVEDINAVPEQYRGLYQEVTDGEDAGKFALSDAAKGLATAYDGVSTQLKSTQADKKKASSEAAQRRVATQAIEDLAVKLGLEVEDASKIAEAIESHITDLSGKVANGEEIKINLDKIKADAEKRINEALSEKDKELDGMRGALNKHLIGDVASRALAEAKGSVDLLMPHVKSHTKVFQDGDSFVVRVVDADGEARSDGAGGWMTVGALVKEMKGDDKFARAFESEAPGGSGTPPGAGSQKQGLLKKGEELSSVQKISSGLNKGQYKTGTGQRASG